MTRWPLCGSVSLEEAASGVSCADTTDIGGGADLHPYPIISAPSGAVIAARETGRGAGGVCGCSLQELVRHLAQ
jgi:hypothetical protein